MDDRDYDRLDEKIAAAEERGILRLDTAMAKIDGKFDMITASLAAIRDENREIRTDMRALRDEMRNEIKYGYAVTRSWGQWLIATVLLVALTLAGLAVSLKQV